MRQTKAVLRLTFIFFLLTKSVFAIDAVKEKFYSELGLDGAKNIYDEKGKSFKLSALDSKGYQSSSGTMISGRCFEKTQKRKPVAAALLQAPTSVSSTLYMVSWPTNRIGEELPRNLFDSFIEDAAGLLSSIQANGVRVGDTVDWEDGSLGVIASSTRGRSKFKVKQFDGGFVSQSLVIEADPSTGLKPGEVVRACVFFEQLPNLDRLSDFDLLKFEHRFATYLGPKLDISEIVPPSSGVARAGRSVAPGGMRENSENATLLAFRDTQGNAKLYALSYPRESTTYLDRKSYGELFTQNLNALSAVNLPQARGNELVWKIQEPDGPLEVSLVKFLNGDRLHYVAKGSKQVGQRTVETFALFNSTPTEENNAALVRSSNNLPDLSAPPLNWKPRKNFYNPPVQVVAPYPGRKNLFNPPAQDVNEVPR